VAALLPVLLLRGHQLVVSCIGATAHSRPARHWRWPLLRFLVHP